MATQPELKKIAEGREAEMFAWEDGTILRLLRDPDGQRRNDLQAAAIEAAAASGVRVPAVFGTATVMGRPGLIMERCDGADYLTLIGRNPLKVFPAARTMGEVHARLHEAAGSERLPLLRDWIRNPNTDRRRAAGSSHPLRSGPSRYAPRRRLSLPR